MAQVLVCFILANVFAAAAMALPEIGAPGLSPAKRVPQIARKLGAPPAPSPLSDHESQSHSSEAASIRSSVAAQEESRSGADSEHRRQSDMSVTGGRVILGGLATTFLVAIFCYIRATRRLSRAAKEADQNPAHLHQLP